MKTYKGMEYITLEEMEEYGYTSQPFGEADSYRMIPLTTEQAKAVVESGMSLMRLYPDDTEEYVDTDDEFQNVLDDDMMFGLEIRTYENWLDKLYIDFHLGHA